MAATTLTLPLFLRRPDHRSGSSRLTARVKQLALANDLGVCAITSADRFVGLDDILRQRIAAGLMDGLDWFTDERARFSVEPMNLMPSARTIVSVGIPYWSAHRAKPIDVPRGRISRYAWGTDYHVILKARMRRLHAAIEAELGRSVEARFLVDTARIVDRAAAARAGLGWYGKHACLIVPGHGSWVMLGDLLLDLDLEPDQPLERDCGRCSICIDRCPTGAIVAPYTIDTPRCLSFQTIEQRGAIPHELRPLLGDWVFGCDVCQEVCPYTGAAAATDDPDFRPPAVERTLPLAGVATRGRRTGLPDRLPRQRRVAGEAARPGPQRRGRARQHRHGSGRADPGTGAHRPRRTARPRPRGVGAGAGSAAPRPEWRSTKCAVENRTLLSARRSIARWNEAPHDCTPRGRAPACSGTTGDRKNGAAVLSRPVSIRRPSIWGETNFARPC